MAETPTPTHHRAALGAGGLVVLLLGYLMTMMDTFVVNVALPTLERELHLSTAGLELVVAGYTLAFTVLLVLGGRLGDMWGRRRVLAVGLIGFTVTSLACGLAQTGTELIVFRVLQGASAALLPTQVLGTIQATTEGRTRMRALSAYASVGGLALAVGQIVGGALLHLDLAGTTWRPLFFINVPLGVLALAGLALVPESRSRVAARIDGRGTVLLALTLLALLVPMSQGRALGWPWWTWVCLVAVIPLGWWLARTELAVERSGALPLLSPQLVSIPQVRRGLALAGPFLVGFGSFMFVFALTVQGLLHHGALVAALAILPMAIAFFVGAFVTQRLLDRIGTRTLAVGGAVQAVGLAATALPMLLSWPDVPLWILTPGLTLAGLGQAMIFGGSFRTVLEPVPADLAGAGSGILVTVQQGALTIGVAALGTLFSAMVDVDPRWAFPSVVGVPIVIALGIALASRRVQVPAPVGAAR